MPKLVNQLDLKNRKELTDAYQVLVTNPVDFQIHRVPVPMFRGAGAFVSENEPTTTPEDPLLVEYIQGDTYIHETSEGLKYYSWDDINSAWANETKLNGIRVFTAVDFPEEVNLDSSIANFQSDRAFANDFYLNKVTNLLYQYSATTGFKFGSVDFTGYEAFRAPRPLIFQGTDVGGYLNIVDYFTAVYTAADDTTKRNMHHSVHQDSFHLLLEGDEGHGGWVWYFDSTRVANSADYFDNLQSKLGIDGITNANRKHFREAKTWNETTTPVQNDKKYRDGDNVFDLVKGILFYNYREGLPANTTDLSLLFEGQTTLSGSSLKSAQDALGNWITPSANDGDYKTGDYIFTREGGTPRIHGPYEFGAGTDQQAWPLYSVLRSPIKHRFKYDDAKITDYSATGEYYPYHNGVMIVDGDLAVDVYVDDIADINDQTVIRKEVTRVDGCTINYNTSMVTWGEGRVNRDPFKLHVSAATATPSVDLLLYYDGDIIRNSVGTSYRFNENFADRPNSNFTTLAGLRSSYTHIAETTSNNFIPDTANESTQWGSGSVQDNDYLEVRYTGSSTNKAVLYKAEVNEATNTINWIQRQSVFGERTFTDQLNIDPVANNQLYTTGDFYVNGDSRKYRYDEDDNAGAGSWTFMEWTRAVEVFVTDKDNTYQPVVVNDYLDATTSVGVTNKRLKQGDQIFVHVLSTGVRTGKQYYFQVLTENPVTLSARQNPRVVQYFSEAEVTRNNLNDLVYSTGDFMDNPATGWRYGPYVEGVLSNALAWPDFKELSGDTTINLQFNPNKEYSQNTTVIHEGSVYRANTSVDGTVNPLVFTEGTGVGEWTLVLKGADDIRATDSTNRYFFEVTADELYFKQKP